MIDQIHKLLTHHFSVDLKDKKRRKRSTLSVGFARCKLACTPHQPAYENNLIYFFKKIRKVGQCVKR
jgi:hypothetical protein